MEVMSAGGGGPGMRIKQKGNDKRIKKHEND
jgi:hypothetical protein